MDKNLQAVFARRGPRRIIAAAGPRRRLLAPAIMFLMCLALGSCASFSNYVSDHWPTWAGGMPKDVPPRPGEPGYEEFISHGQAGVGPSPAIATAPAPAPVAASAPTGTVPAPAAANIKPQPMPPPRAAQPNAAGAVQGGLY